MSQISGLTGKVIRVAGPVVGAIGMDGICLNDVVRVGELGLVGEVIRLTSDQAIIQVYEDTSGVRVGEPVYHTGQPLVALLGPGLLGRVYDGLQRPLRLLAGMTGDFIERGITAAPLPQNVDWTFTPCAKEGEYVGAGDVLGWVPESLAVEHAVMVPPGIQGRVVEIRGGEFKLNEVVTIIESDDHGRGDWHEITLVQQWPVRIPRPSRARLDACEPLITGTRIIDAFFPVAKGGSAIIPGGFGTGKTVTEHSLARWADVDVVVYVGCGERGNEMAEVLEEFPTLEDPRTNTPLMDRTVLIANTSNMPVAAREASIYIGITIAEYYRDMGYDVLLLADSTSRWGEALREISGRLEEMPGEEGYPAYLAARLAEFYERAGRVVCLGRDSDGNSLSVEKRGSVTIVGAVSPPGGDFSEPVTQSSMRMAGTFWALDYSLSRRRHFPAINWTRSYSLYDLQDWFNDKTADDWGKLTAEAMALLQREAELLEIVQLVGPDALAETERAVLAVARMLREDFLHQSSYHPTDRFCSPEKAYSMLDAIIGFYHHAQAALEKGVALTQIISLPIVTEITQMKELQSPDAVEKLRALLERMELVFAELGKEHRYAERYPHTEPGH
jgi:V/A-type H+-transporting ATPase subunit A